MFTLFSLLHSCIYCLFFFLFHLGVSFIVSFPLLVFPLISCHYVFLTPASCFVSFPLPISFTASTPLFIPFLCFFSSHFLVSHLCLHCLFPLNISCPSFLATPTPLWSQLFFFLLFHLVVSFIISFALFVSFFIYFPVLVTFIISSPLFPPLSSDLISLCPWYVISSLISSLCIPFVISPPFLKFSSPLLSFSSSLSPSCFLSLFPVLFPHSHKDRGVWLSKWKACFGPSGKLTHVFTCRNEEGEEQLHLRRLQVPFNYATGEALLYDVTPNIEPRDPCSAPKQGKFDSDAISRESLLGCMLNQDHTLYCDQNSANTLSNLNDMVFKDTNATLNVPGDTEPSPAVGNVVKAETTVQEIMESLQQIFGDGELIESLHVEPDELKSWESTLLQMSCHGGFGDDLSDILNNDILSYVEEQLQKDVGLNLPQQIDGIPACLSGLDPLQNQDPDQGGELDFDWALETQTQLIPNGVQMTAAQETMKLSHMDFPQPNSSGPNGLTFNNVLPNSFPQTQSQLKASSMDNNLGAFPLRQPSTNPVLLQMIPANQTFGLQDQNKEGQLNNVFTFQGTKCSKSVTHQADSCGETFASNISNKAVFSSSLSCMQSHFPVQTPNGNSQRQAWPQQQQLITGQQMGSFQRNPTDIGSLNKFMTPETSNPLPVQQLLERSPASTSCMYRNAAPGLPVNGVHHSQPRLNPAPSQIPSNPSCFYQVGGRAISGMASIPNLDEASLSCQMPTGLKPNGLLGQQKQYLNFSEQTQVKSQFSNINLCRDVKLNGLRF